MDKRIYTDLLDDVTLHTGLAESVVRSVFDRLILDDQVAFAFGLAGKTVDDYEDQIHDLNGSIDELNSDLREIKEILDHVLYRNGTAKKQLTSKADMELLHTAHQKAM
jgi:hypothetical protein